MVDVDRLEELCNADIERVLNLIKVDFRYNNGWICMDCCFHKSKSSFFSSWAGHPRHLWQHLLRPQDSSRPSQR